MKEITVAQATADLEAQRNTMQDIRKLAVSLSTGRLLRRKERG
jgi:hypothetical protein